MDYHSQYQVKITNSRKSANDFFVILPIPQSNDYQTIDKKVYFSPEPIEIKTDEKYKNKYGVWRLNLKPHQTAFLEEKFLISVKARHIRGIKKFKPEDYKKNQEHKLYIQDNVFINSENSEIKNIIEKIAKERHSVVDIIKRINKYIIEKLKYGEPIAQLYSSDEALKNDCVDCGGFSALFVSLCVAAGIPARIISGFWAGYEPNTMHAWAEALLSNGKWIAVDPAVEHLRKHNRTKKFAKLNHLHNDRVVLSVGCDIPIIVNNRKYFTPILQNPFIIARQGEKIAKAQVRFITNATK